MKKITAPFGQTHGLCEWNANISRCGFPGSMSHGQLGSGPWYCAWHFRCGDGATGAAIVRQSQKWDGKPETYLAMRRAYVYGKKPAREPGDDEQDVAA